MHAMGKLQLKSCEFYSTKYYKLMDREYLDTNLRYIEEALDARNTPVIHLSLREIDSLEEWMSPVLHIRGGHNSPSANSRRGLALGCQAS